jgi:DNA mismatch repair protein MutS
MPFALPKPIRAQHGALGQHDVLVDRLSRALVPSPPLLARDGGFIARRFDARLDELITLRDEGRRLILNLEARYRGETAIASLKVRHNNVLGYYVEVTPLHADKLKEPFIHRQSLAGAVRFTTVELGDLEVRINAAAEKALALELALFADLLGEVRARAEDIARAAEAMAALDVAAGLAELAAERRYCRPIVDDSTAFRIVGGRHPVVETLAEGDAEAGRFVANDCDLSETQRLWLVTGPNMAGKSTFLRQNALIAILAQIGSYVPASSARIGVVDRLFSRVGAADDLAHGRSTFMVEMVEAAAILNQAGPRSLVILDEIGRGTATFDGLSIAWAAIEHLHDINRARTLFATHYHELTALKDRLPALSCRTMRVKEWQGQVVFLHEVAPGAADRSYGIHVAKLAGLPVVAISRAEEILAELEHGEQSGALARLTHDLPLFQAAKANLEPAPAPDPVRALLRETDADTLTPRTALDLLYRLKALLKDT